jgi:hypothetical protein
MNWLRRTVQFLSSKTLAAGLLGFLLSLFATEILYAVPKGMELEVAEVLFISIFLLMIHFAGFLSELRKRWWGWRRITMPARIGVLGPYFDDSKKGSKCELQFPPNSGWIDYFSQIDPERKQFDVTEIDWTEIASKYFVIVNPFGEIYVEGDKRRLSTYEKIKDFIADGGIFCCTGGFPFYYYWDPIIEKPIDTTPRTRTTQGGLIEDTRFFTDSLVTRDFGAIITNDPPKPKLVHSYQEESDVEFFGNLLRIGETDLIWEFRSLSEETRGLIPGLRVNHGKYVKVPLAAIPYGQGYLIIAGMALKPAGIEFKKLAEGLVSFTSTIAKRRKTDWQKKYEETKSKLKMLRLGEHPSRFQHGFG